MRSFAAPRVTLGVTALLMLTAIPRIRAQGNSSPPSISGLEKGQYCVYGDLLAIDGARFGEQGEHGFVTIYVPLGDARGIHTIRDFPLSVKDWSDTLIHARLYLPEGALTGTWLVLVHRDDGQVAPAVFSTEACPAQADDTTNPAAHQPLPMVSDFPSGGFHPGDVLVIQGANFGADGTGGSVTLVGAFTDAGGRTFYREFPVAVAQWTSTVIQVPLNLPAGFQPGAWAVTVHRADGEAASQTFTLAPPPPSG